MDAADLGIAEASALIAGGKLSASELARACLARIAERDGTHSHDGDPASINAWVRVYEERALAAAARADDDRPDPLPPLWGIPIGLKDLYGVAGEPLTASSSLLDDRPAVDCDVWARLRAQGMILLGHLHTHEFAVGGTTDQVGNPWALERSAGGSSGGSAAALAARMVPAATGTDTAGSLRIPSALSRHVDDQADARASSPCAASSRSRPASITPGRWRARLEDCAPAAGGHGGARPGPPAQRAGGRLARRAAAAPRGRAAAGRPAPRRSRRASTAAALDADVADGLDAALARCGRSAPPSPRRPPPGVPLDVGDDFLDVLNAELLIYHRRFDGRRELYRPSLREWVERGRGARHVRPSAMSTPSARRRETTAGLAQWLARRADRGVDRADGALRRAAARRRLRARRQRLRADLAHPLLELAGLPRRRAAGRRRLAQRPARERLR